MKLKLAAIIIVFSLAPGIFSQFPQSYPFKTYIDNDNIYIAGEINNDMAVFYFDNNGSLGNAVYNSSGPDKANGLVLGQNGSIYAAGYVYNSSTNNDISLVKFTPGEPDPVTMAVIWDYASGDDKAVSIIKDLDGNIIICGYVSSVANKSDFYTAMYSQEGVCLWTNVLNLPGNQYATDLLTDGNFVYVIGYTDLSYDVSNYGYNVIMQTIKINNSSSTYTVVDLPNSGEIPLSFVISENAYGSYPPIPSKIIATGITDVPGLISPDYDYFVMKFTRDIFGGQNVFEWWDKYGSAGNTDVGTKVLCNDEGMPVLTGYATINNNFDFCTVKYDRDNGNWSELNIFDNQGGNDKATGMDRNGRTYVVAGYSEYAADIQYISTFFSDNNGVINEIWTEDYSPLPVSNRGASYYTGHHATTAFTQNGNIITFTQAWNSNEQVFGIVEYDTLGNQVFTAEYDSNPADLKKPVNKAYEFNMLQNYPNPFNPVTKISYTLPEKSLVTIKVYDILGREVANLVNTYKEMGDNYETFDASQLSAGIYIYKLTAVGQKNVYEKISKMVLVK